MLTSARLAVAAFLLTVSAFGQTTTNTITLKPAALTFQYQLGATTLPAAQNVQVQSSPAGLNFNVAVSGSPFNAAWLLVSASSGKAPTTLKIQVNPTGLPAGVYVGTITVTGTTGTPAPTQSVTVNLLISASAPTVSSTPSTLNFTYTTGGPIPDPSLTSAFLLSSSGAPLTATLAVSGATWLKVTPTGNISLIGLLNTITVTVDPTGLAPKVYTAAIKITAPASVNKTLNVNVSLTVNAAPPKALATWPPGVIEGSPQSVVTLAGSGFFSNSTVAVTGFTPDATVTVTDGTSTVTETFSIPVYQPTNTTLRIGMASPLPSGSVGVPYTQALAASGGSTPYTFSVASGALPPGLAIVGNLIAGTPSAAGSYTFALGVTDSGTPSVQAYQSLKMTIAPLGSTALRIQVAAAPLPEGIVGAAYGPLTLSAVGGTGGPYTWSVAGLPPGLVLSSAGVLSGTPTTEGTTGSLTASVVSDTALLVTVPADYLANEGTLRLTVTTPAPGGGSSNEAQFLVYGPEPQIAAVVNSASYGQGTVSPGEIINIFGLGLGPSALTVFDPSTPPIPAAWPASAPSTSVTVGGLPAPVLYTSATQTGVIVPYAISGTSAQIVVTYGSLSSQAFTVAVAPTDPGVYTTAASGQGQGAILNYNAATQDFSINAPSNPAAKGSIVVIYVTGAGATTSNVSNQLIPWPPAPAVTPVLPPTVTIGGQGAAVLAAQAPAGSVPGLLQLNVTVPATVTAGQVLPVVVTIGGVTSQPGVTMAVR